MTAVLRVVVARRRWLSYKSSARCCFGLAGVFDYGDAAFSFTRRLRPVVPSLEDPVVLHPAGKDRHDFGALENCLVAVDKPLATLTFDLIAAARSAMLSRHYRVGHTGALDVMSSGLTLLLFGKATKHLVHYVDLERTYTGTLRLGLTTKTYDTLSETVSSRPWAHITDAQVEGVVRALEGRTVFLSSPDFFGAPKKTEMLCHLRKNSEKKKKPKALWVGAFEVCREAPGSADFEFRVVCRTTLSVSCLIHHLGERLGCGAHVRQCTRTKLGEFKLEEAWEAEDLWSHISHLRRMAYLKNFDLYDSLRNAYWRSIGPRTNRQKKVMKRRMGYARKIRREIREGRREPILTALCY